MARIVFLNRANIDDFGAESASARGLLGLSPGFGVPQPANRKRPAAKTLYNIKELFAADLQVLDWIAGFAEFLTIMHPGFTQKLRIDLREVLMEELDFRREARFADIFRRNARKTGWKFFTAPHVYFEYSGDEVLVQEFVSGLWLWEVIAIREQ